MNGDVKIHYLLSKALVGQLKEASSMFKLISFSDVFWEHKIEASRLSKVWQQIEISVLIM